MGGADSAGAAVGHEAGNVQPQWPPALASWGFLVGAKSAVPPLIWRYQQGVFDLGFVIEPTDFRYAAAQAVGG